MREPVEVIEPPRHLPRATLAGTIILVVCSLVSFAFVVQRGSIALPELAVPVPTLSPVTTSPPFPGAGASPAAVLPAATGVAKPAATPTPTLRPTPSPTTAPTATPLPTPQPTATPSPTPRPTTRATSSPSPTVDTGTASQSRLSLLRPCADRSDCWIYAIRAGDTLIGIANFFGVPLQQIYAMNPGLQGTILQIDQEIEIPTPTR